MKQQLKRASLTIMLALLSSAAYSQKCKYIKEATDPFTKKITKAAQMAIGPTLGMNELLFELSDGKLYLGLRVVFQNFDDVAFKKGDKITIKLSNDDLIELTPPKDVEVATFNISNRTFKQWIVMQEVSETVYKQIATSPIIALKFHLKTDYVINGIKERQTEKIMENAACMLANR